MQLAIFKDARYFQLCFQIVLLGFGTIVLGWQTQWINNGIYLVSGLIFHVIAETYFVSNQRRTTPFFQRWKQGVWSVIISCLSLCLLLRVNFWGSAIAASGIAVFSKYFIQVKGKHVFNPSALAIVLMVAISGDAWFSPAQWGSGVMIFFTVLCLGCIVVTKVQKLAVSLVFLCVFSGLLFWRQIIFLHWPMDFFLQSISTGSLLLFGFFMITDPKTIPNHFAARMIWVVAIAALSFYLSVFHFLQGAPIWVLVLMQPMVPILDYFFKAPQFQWHKPEAFASSKILSIHHP
jgi:enediyne biosynthesis protein E5